MFKAGKTLCIIVLEVVVIQFLCCIVLSLLLSDPFQGMEAWQMTMEPQKIGNSVEPGPKTKSRQRACGTKSL